MGEQKVAATAKNHQGRVGIRESGEHRLQFVDRIELYKPLALALNAEGVVFKQLEILYIFHITKFINADTHQATPVV